MTELVFVLDRSGSMAGTEQDTIGGFNAMIEKQRKKPGAAVVSTVLFSSTIQVIHDRVPLENVPPLTEEVYSVGGCTALLDAVGGAIHHIGNVHRYARPEDRPEKTLFVITTDGLENASHHYSYDLVKRMIEHEQEKYGWEFIFLGADIDAAAEARRMGIRPDRSASYRKSRDGMDCMFSLVDDAVCATRSGRSFDRELRDFSAREKAASGKPAAGKKTRNSQN